MEKFKIGKTLGDGTFGQVFEAQNIHTGQIVAIKKMKRKNPDWDDCIGQPEIKALLTINHSNIIQLLEVIKQKNEVYFIFESMQQNLYTFLKESQPSHIQIRNILFQTLQGLHYLHTNDFFHRDMKPENILIRHHKVKIADLGLIRRISNKKPLTDYISTRWYRAPEVILKSSHYNAPIDIFAVGCIMAELYLQRPLFPGSSEQDQLFKILEVMGAPSSQDWPDGHKLGHNMGIILEGQGKDLGDWGGMGEHGIKLCKAMLSWNPMLRPSAKDCLNHPYFKVGVAKAPQHQKVNQALSPRSIAQKKQVQTIDLLKQARYKAGQKMGL